jgi:hypothetical protein
VPNRFIGLFSLGKVIILSRFSGTALEIRHVSDCFAPDFVSFSFFPILFRLPDNVSLFRMESFLDHVNDFPDDEMATLLPME